MKEEEIKLIPFKYADITLIDGSTARVKIASKDDLNKIIEFFNALPPTTKYMRFLGFIKITPELLLPDKGLAMIASIKDEIIAHVCYSITGKDSAEIGIVVHDKYQNKGLGTAMLGIINEIAYKQGIEKMEAYVHPENTAMIKVLSKLGNPYEIKINEGYLKVTYLTYPHEDAIEAFDKRESFASRNAVKYFFEPRSIAVIGASREEGSIGHELYKNIIQGGFTGVCYPVNKRAKYILANKCYSSIKEIEDEIDLAFIAVPAKEVINVAKECAEKGVKGLVVISAGFSETGEEGRKLENELLKICRENGIRLVGPNCLGLINTDPKIRLNGQFTHVKAIEGNIGFFSQSGALGISVIEFARGIGVGLSQFISVGNKADISGNDVLCYWEKDERTKVILMYIESFGNPRKFIRIARRISRNKPIIVVKGGITSAGLRAAQSHTGAMLASSNFSIDALLKQAGVIRTNTLNEMFSVAALLATQELPKGRRIGIITNAGGAGILAADACETHGLLVPEFPQEIQKSLKEILPKIASVRNPVDITAHAMPKDYYEAMLKILENDVIDALIIIYQPAIENKTEELVNKLIEAINISKYKIPIIAVLPGQQGQVKIIDRAGIKIPSYPFPENAVVALSKAAEYAELRNKDYGKIVRPKDVKRIEALSFVSKKLMEYEGWLSFEECIKLLSYYGLPFAKTYICDKEELKKIELNLKGKFAIKASGKEILHKSDVGAVKLNVEAERIYDEAVEMESKLKEKGLKVEKFIVQEMVEGGIEMLVGVTNDPSLGPLVVCGFGGIFTELIKDISIGLTPLTDTYINEMIENLKLYPVLKGYRKGVSYDITALKDVIARIGALVEDIPASFEIDLNPVVVLPEGNGAKIIDARIRISKAKAYVPLVAKSAQ